MRFDLANSSLRRILIFINCSQYEDLVGSLDRIEHLASAKPNVAAFELVQLLNAAALAQAFTW